MLAGNGKLNTRDYYWDHAMVWLDDERLALGGLGDHDLWIIPGARVIDVSQGRRNRYGQLVDAETFAFAGPGDRFFTAHGLLYAVAETGL